jgi:hypothetical protein
MKRKDGSKRSDNVPNYCPWCEEPCSERKCFKCGREYPTMERSACKGLADSRNYKEKNEFEATFEHNIYMEKGQIQW